MATLKTLVSFNGANGSDPSGSLIADAAEDLFGTASPTVFEIVHTGGSYATTPTTLVSFDDTNGYDPYGSLIADAAGDLFGTTPWVMNSSGTVSYGTVFEIANTGGSYASAPTTLITFDGSNGKIPGGLIADAAGDLFGTAGSSGAGEAFGPGTVFEIAKTSTGYASAPTTLVTFNGSNGSDPGSSLIADAAGDLFGTTAGGGADDYGTVFEIAKTSTGYASTPTTLVDFNGTNGSYPEAGLIADAAGNLFGTTWAGGANNIGTVFEIAKTSTGYASAPTTLVSFDRTNGAGPCPGLIADAAGDLFGTTDDGGANSDGTVFEIAKTSTSYASTPTTLVSFDGSNGANPLGGLLADAAGNLFGTTLYGGPDNEGTVFELTNTGFQVETTTINLPAGNNMVTVTDTTFSHGPVTINDGASGNNTISAAGDTAASAGESLTYVTGTGTDSFTGGFENDTVQVSAAAVGGDTLTGGSGINTLVLASSGSVSLGGVSKFAMVDLFAGNNTVTVTDTTLSGGAVTILDGASGNNTISAAGDTAASEGKSLTYVAGTGTDSFTGGFENDTVQVSAAALGSDVLTGGSGTNTLVLTSAGSVNLGGVSKFATIYLVATDNTVTVTDMTLSGGSVTIRHGSSVDNNISAAGDTAASRGKSLAFLARTGVDSFIGGFENDFVHVRAATLGSDTLTGGSGANALVLTSAGDVALGAVSNFTAIDLFAGNNAVTVTDATLSGGFVALHAAASGSTNVNAADDTEASAGKDLTYVAGTGTDTFTGEFENDTVRVSAAALGGDTLTGGRGTNTLALLSAGNVNLGGVSKFATVDLRAGDNTVTVTDKTLRGRPMAIHDGASGDTSITAAGDTAASTGHRLTFFAGTGTDSFVGGFENDTIFAGTGSGTYTSGSGTDRFVFIQDNLPNQTLDNFKIGSDELLFYGIQASNGFDLGATDNALNPDSPAEIDPSIFIANASGDFTSADQRFAYDTSNGQLHYSATGSDTSESLVATLTGEPAITAGNLLFLH